MYKSYEGVMELMVPEQYTNLCSKDVVVHLIEHSPKDLEELARIAKQYLVARNKKLLSRGALAKQVGRGGHSSRDLPVERSEEVVGCYYCDGRDHQVAECPSKHARSCQGKAPSRGRNFRFFRCRAVGHRARDCRLSQRPQPD